jgi:hypothetical protein
VIGQFGMACFQERVVQRETAVLAGVHRSGQTDGHIVPGPMDRVQLLADRARRRGADAAEDGAGPDRLKGYG